MIAVAVGQTTRLEASPFCGSAPERLLPWTARAGCFAGAGDLGAAAGDPGEGPGVGLASLAGPRNASPFWKTASCMSSVLAWLALWAEPMASMSSLAACRQSH